VQVALDAPKDEFTRDAAIQRFEYSYELAWKLLKRYLSTEAGENVDGLARRELFRIAKDNALLGDVTLWMTFHDARNRTSHVYNEQVANEVYLTAKSFLPEAESLYENLEKRLNPTP
jgi:nucleotidyltransferase substrate binding protein (TIGR01987 family)